MLEDAFSCLPNFHSLEIVERKNDIDNMPPQDPTGATYGFLCKY